MKRILIAALAGALVSLVLIGGGMGLAAAQGEDDPAQTFLGRVAEKLGIGEDDLRSAMTEAQQDIIDERVAEGSLTPEQGERLKERIGEGKPLGPQGLHRIREATRHRAGRLLLGSAATVLNMEPEDLRSELKDGKTLAQVAEAHGMSVEEFTAALLDEVRGKLDELVAEGKLTETQADGIFKRLESKIEDLVNRSRSGMSHGPRGSMLPGQRGPMFQSPARHPFEPTESNIEA